MMKNFTHYSLFDGVRPVADFAAIDSAGGLPALLAELHKQVASQPNYCVSVGPDANGHSGTLHPDGEQISFCLGRRFSLILYTQAGLRDQASELAAEGNASAVAAAQAADSDC